MPKTSIVRLYKFYRKTKSKPVKSQPYKNRVEMAAFLHIIQIVASGGKEDVKHCLGNYERSLV